MRTVPVKSPWQRKLIPVFFSWILFIFINSFINQAPYSKDSLPVTSVLLFVTPLFVALYFSLALLVNNRRRGFLGSLLICSLLLVRLYGFTNPLTVLLLFATTAFLEWYFGVQYPKTHRPTPRPHSPGIEQ